jgi:glycosyltransferase involved in cell wall biosynthesis
LISENKNIETTLFALPEIVKKHPSLIYLIIGKTHPEVIKNEGKNTVKTGYNCDRPFLEDNVVFINEYVELKQLLEYLTLSDIYLFSSKDPNQAVSGTLLTP